MTQSGVRPHYWRRHRFGEAGQGFQEGKDDVFEDAKTPFWRSHPSGQSGGAASGSQPFNSQDKADVIGGWLPSLTSVRHHDMVYITRNDRWLGYGALICAATVQLVWWLIRREFLAAILMICLEPLGLYLAVRGMLFGRWLSRICSGVAFAVLAWSVYAFIAAISAHAKIHM